MMSSVNNTGIVNILGISVNKCQCHQPGDKPRIAETHERYHAAYEYDIDEPVSNKYNL